MISKDKSYQAIGRAVNIANGEHARPANAVKAAKWDTMLTSSLPYYHMEQLIRAFEALGTWRDEEAHYRLQNPTPPSVPASLKRAYEGVEAAMTPLLSEGFLTFPDDETADDETYQTLRDWYLPEAIIAYNTVLHVAGYLITRDSLLKSMDLSVAVAKEENQLTGPLVRSGRMKELVKSFALSAKAILVLKGLGNKPWKRRRDREGKDPGIWEIGPQGKAGEESESDGELVGDE